MRNCISFRFSGYVGNGRWQVLFCGGYSKHQRSKCPARDAVCNKCHKKGHYTKVCRSLSVSNSATSASVYRPTLASVISASIPAAVAKATTRVVINGVEVDSLIDSGSTESFIHPNLVKQHSLKVTPSNCQSVNGFFICVNSN